MLGPRKQKGPQEEFNVSYDRFGRRKFTLIQKQQTGAAPPPPPGPPPSNLVGVKKENKGQASGDGFKAPLNKRNAKAPAQRSHLQARDEDLELEKLMGKVTVVDPNAEKRDQGAFYCELCDCALHDSQAYVEHLNGKYHNRRKGMTMRVERLGIDRIREKLKSLKQGDEKSNTGTRRHLLGELPRQAQNQLNSLTSLDLEIEVEETTPEKPAISKPQPPPPPPGPPSSLKPIPSIVSRPDHPPPPPPSKGSKPAPPSGPPPLSLKKPPAPAGPPPFLKNVKRPPAPDGPPPGFKVSQPANPPTMEQQVFQEEENEDFQMEGFGFQSFGGKKKR